MRFIGLKEKITTVNALLLLLTFCTCFSLETQWFSMTEAQEYFLPQGASYHSYATELRH